MKQTSSRVIAIFLFATTIFGQQTNGNLRGRVVDALGAVVVGANVTIAAANGAERATQTNQNGEFIFANLAPGKYVVRANATGFASYENGAVEIGAAREATLDIALSVAQAEAQVNVGEEEPVNTNPEANASALVLKEDDIEALPDNDEELAAALQALAGPAAGPNGGEVFIDGFSGGRLPPRDTIREIRINQNPFSSEYDRLGLGRIEILTKPGTDDLRGEFEFEFEDEAFNSRNPYAPNRAPFQVREFSANFGGPIVKRRASFFVDLELGDTANNALINALILDPNLNVAPFQLAVLTPSKDFEISPRFDIQINERNTLVARYSFSREKSENAGLGGFDLLSRAFETSGTEHSIRLTETAVISGSVINEARFQYLRRRSEQAAANAAPTVRVLDAFTTGGANVGFAFSNEDRFELQNYTSFAIGNHSLKTGGRFRHFKLSDSSPNNFAGSFSFAGGLAPQLNGNNQIVRDQNGNPVLISIDSIERYRRTILFQQLGLSSTEIRARGGGATQFSIAGGNPLAAIKQADLGVFLQDDWRVRPDLTLSFGLRYENQTNISSNFNLAPRFGFAYAPGAASGNNRPKTVFRGGVGVFYDRFSENLSLQAIRFNGINQQQFVVTDPAILDAVIFTQNGVSNVPTVNQLAAFAQRQTTRVVSPDSQSPYTIQTALSVERQLPFKTTLSATFVNAATRRLLRSRNINAPVGGIRPIPTAGNVFQYESTGKFNQSQLIFNVRSNFADGFSIFANYAFGRARSDTDGAGTFPANTYDLSDEYGRAALDIRHRFVVGGNFEAPFGINLSPFITFRSGVPFNITTGEDSNGDAVFTERPAFATDLAEPGVVVTKFGAFDPTPDAGDEIVPRNHGVGPEFFIVNLRASKEFGFGKKNGGSAAASSGQSAGGGGNRGGINSPFGGGGGGQRSGGNDGDESLFNVEFSVQIRNLFNRTNGGTPVGNLRSRFFGEPVSLAGGFGFGGGGGGAAGNRRIEFEIEFSF